MIKVDNTDTRTMSTAYITSFFRASIVDFEQLTFSGLLWNLALRVNPSQFPFSSQLRK